MGAEDERDHRKPTLILQTICFDDSDYEAAYRLGMALYDVLTRPVSDPLVHGPGILVFAGVRPDHVDLSAAEKLVLLPVLGPATYMLDAEAVVARISAWHDKLAPGHVIPVPISENWRAEESDLPGKNLLTEIYGKEDRPNRTVDEIVLATLRLFETEKDKTRLFISHAKADLSATEDAAKKIHDYVVNDTTGRAFFDVNDLGAGESLEGQIDGALKQGVFVLIRTDSYSSRSWCQKELLQAKKHGLPTLTVEILKKGESLSSAYLGNSPSMPWNEETSPQDVVSHAFVECLRAAYFASEANRIMKLAIWPGDTIALCRPPELLDLVQGPLSSSGAQVVIHPDPELPVVLRDLLVVSNPRLKLVTPTTAYRRIGGEQSSVANPLDGLQVAMSLSDSPTVDGPEGYTEQHVFDATIYLARCLISAGAHIAYGGDFRRGGYTEILDDLISAYRQTAGNKNDFLHSYLGAVIKLEDASPNLKIKAHHMDHGEFKELAKVPSPSDPASQGIPSGLYFSDMRRVMAEHTGARVVLGGGSVPRIDELEQKGYGGRYPGVVEEAWRSLAIGQPLYVVGGYGGAAGLVAQLVEGKETPPDLQDATWTKHASFRARAKAIDASPYRKELGLPKTMEDLAEAVRQLSAGLLESNESAIGWNGLTIEENHELLWSRDPVTIASLVFKGIQNVRRKKTHGKLEIELVDGSVTSARDIDCVSVGVFDGLPLGGAGAAVDRAVAGRATLARAGGESLIALDTDEIAADWLYLASLGKPEDLEHLPERIEEASRKTAAIARRHGFSRLGVVAFGGTMVDDIEKTTSSMVNGFEDLAGQTAIVWFENRKHQYDALLETFSADERVNVTTHRYTEPAPEILHVREEQLVLNVKLVGDELRTMTMPPSGTGIARERNTALAAETLQKLSRGSRSGRRTPNAGGLDERGQDIAEMLFGDDAHELLRRCEGSKVTIIHDVSASRLPFETLMGRGSEATESIRPAVNGGINRRLAVSGVSLEQLFAKPPHTGKLKVLLVVNPLGDLDGAEVEAKAVKSILDKSNAVDLIELWNKEATKDAFLDRIKQADALHYCGHAFFDGPGDEESGLNLWGDPLLLADLKNEHIPVRVVFANACEAGRVRGKAESVTEAASFAEFFLRSGIEAFLGTYWQVGDKAAAKFASSVYESMASGETLDKSVRAGRQKLFDLNEPEWANYILYGDGRFRLVTA